MFLHYVLLYSYFMNFINVPPLQAEILVHQIEKNEMKNIKS